MGVIKIMGQSTNGQICYGIPFEEGYEFPWKDNDIYDWWIKETGWEESWPYPTLPYTNDGQYNLGYSKDDPRIDEYYNSRRKWLKSHPLPIVEMNYCSSDFPMMILACPSTVKKARRGYPEWFDPSELQVLEKEKDSLTKFLEKYNLNNEEEGQIGMMGWYLSSYWG